MTLFAQVLSKYASHRHVRGGVLGLPRGSGIAAARASPGCCGLPSGTRLARIGFLRDNYVIFGAFCNQSKSGSALTKEGCFR